MTDWLMVIITAIYVVATILICMYNARSAKAAKRQADIAQKQMQEMVEQYNSNNRPIMTVRFDIVRSGILCLIFENVGPKPAEKVSIQLNDAFLENLSKDNDRLRLKEITEASLFLASKQKITVFLGGQTDFKKIASVPAIITISYNSKYVETTTIDINQYAFMMVYSSSEEDISQHLKKIKEQNEKFYKNLVKSVDKLHVPVLQNVVIHNQNELDSLKFKVLKMVSINPGISCDRLAEQLEESKESVLDMILELERLDRLLTLRPNYDEPEDDYKTLCYRR